MKLSAVSLGGACLIYCLLTYSARASTIKKRSFSDNLHSGIKLAGQMLGIDRAADVANLVAKAFSSNESPSSERPSMKRNDQASTSSGSMDVMQGNGLLSQLLQIIGLDGGKIGALAVNGIIFIAQMVRESIAMAGTYFTQSIFDWRTIINYIVERVQEAQRNGTVLAHSGTTLGGVRPQATIVTI